MKSQQSLLHVLFPTVRAELLCLLFIDPQKQRYVRELRNHSGLALCTVQDELRKLTAVGLVTSWSNGYHRFYRANRDHPLFPELRRLVDMSGRLPQTTRSVLRRPARGANRNRVRKTGRALPADRPINWHLFSA